MSIEEFLLILEELPYQPIIVKMGKERLIKYLINGERVDLIPAVILYKFGIETPNMCALENGEHYLNLSRVDSYTLICAADGFKLFDHIVHGTKAIEFEDIRKAIFNIVGQPNTLSHLNI